ncbi:MAG: RimK family alpha-L-glutamate ligase [Thermoleophilia bacterium]|nr:RimK family alpha-L-glutamate ligase [Thermoleophilia bacterium]
MRVGILGQRQGWHTQTLLAALARRGITAECFPVTQLTARVAAHPRLTVRAVTLEAYDTLFVRAIPGGSLEQIIFRVDALHRLEHLGVRVVNSAAAIERGVDKYYTATLLEDAGLPTPRTVVTECWDDALAAFHELGGDVVVKPLFGSEGRGMVRVSDADTAYRVLRALELGRYVYCLQEFVPHGCEDIRVFVVGGQVVGAMLRRGKDWKTNAAQGAEGQPYDVDDRVGEMSVRAAQVLGAEHAGVDILPCDAGGYAVLEVNTIPGWRALRSATGVDAAQHLVDHVLGGSG